MRLGDRLRTDCLVADGSLLFPGQELWTPPIFEGLVRQFNENPKEATGRSRKSCANSWSTLGPSRELHLERLSHPPSSQRAGAFGATRRGRERPDR